MNKGKILFLVLKISLMIDVFKNGIRLNPAFALDVTHQIRQNATFDSLSLGNSCSLIEKSEIGTRCNPALSPYSKGEGIYFSVVAKSDGESIENGRELIFKPLSVELVKKLFEQSNYNSLTLNSDIIFRTSLFELTYSPYYLLADLLLFNPANPEISMHLVNRQTLRLTSGMEILRSKIGGDQFYLSAGASIFYYEHQYSKTRLTLFTLSTTPPDKLVQFQTEYGMASDLGFYLGNTHHYFPKLSLQVKNLGSKIKRDEDNVNSAYNQETLFLFEPYTTFGLGKEFLTDFGGIELSTQIPVEGLFEIPRWEYATLGFSYGLNLATIYMSANKYYQNVGVRFNSENFNVGITYTREQDLGDISQSKESSVYTGVDIIL